MSGRENVGTQAPMLHVSTVHGHMHSLCKHTHTNIYIKILNMLINKNKPSYTKRTVVRSNRVLC